MAARRGGREVGVEGRAVRVGRVRRGSGFPQQPAAVALQQFHQLLVEVAVAVHCENGRLVEDY